MSLMVCSHRRATPTEILEMCAEERSTAQVVNLRLHC